MFVVYFLRLEECLQEAITLRQNFGALKSLNVCLHSTDCRIAPIGGTEMRSIPHYILCFNTKIMKIVKIIAVVEA